MNTNIITPRPPLPRWIWVIAGIIVVAILIVVAVFWTQRPEESGSAQSAATTEPTAPPSGLSRPTTGPDVVTGCLAEGQDITMLLTTQDTAPHTKTGAVEFATAYGRFLQRWPIATADEIRTAIPRAWNVEGGFNQGQYDEIAGKNPSAGLVPDGIPFHLTAAIGRWYVESYDGDTAKIAVGLAYVIGDAISPLYKSVATYTLAWTDHGWATKASELKYTPQQLFDQSLGSPYAGGC